MKLWSQKVKEKDGFACIYCGAKVGDINKNNKKIKCDSHHLLSRDIKNSPLKFDIRNSALLCPEHHKFSGIFSAHRSPINFYEWFRASRPEQYKFVLENTNVRVDLENLEVLNYIEECLLTNKLIDIAALVEIDKKTKPIETLTTTSTTSTTTERDLFNSLN
jgi:hypothetical protein